ncbi:glutaredoxin family protein [Bacillus rugosus]
MKPNIIVFTAANCIFCKKQKEWLDKHSFEYLEKKVEVEKHKRELLERKVLGVPFTIITFEREPKEITVAGFNVNKLESLLLGD